MASITSQEFKTLAKYIYSIAGIYLDDSKGYLIESRLNPLLVAFQLSSFSELYYRAKSDASGELEKHIIDAISTNETFFFRDTAPFDLLKFKILPELIDAKKVHKPAGKTPISIWSAACSTGQEVYSIAMSLIEVLPNNSTYEISIFGSDISQQAITQASYGQYNKLEVSRGLPPDYLQKYFQASDGGWRVKDFIRSMASFKVMNLMHPFGAIGPFDIVFCRNVAI
ncbi:MAG: CheR family methyltransferase, partial [Desulfovermiculus sp.]